MSNTLNKRCPLQGECERTCKFEGQELKCVYYYNNARDDLKIEDQERLREDQEREDWREADLAEMEHEERLNEVAAEIRALTASALNNIVEIGRRMREAKELLPHGEFGKWLKDNTGYSTSTASNFMRIFDAYADTQGSVFGAAVNCQTFGSLSYSKALALLDVPSEEREEFVETHDVEGMSTRQLQAIIRERDEARKQVADLKENIETQLEEQRTAYDVDMADARGRLEEAEAAKAKAVDEIAALKAKLAEAQEAAKSVAVEQVPDKAAIEAAVKAEQEKLAGKIKKAEAAKEKAEKEKAKAEQDLAAVKVAQEEAAAIAEQEKKTLAEQVQTLQKKLAVASSSDMTVFKLYFDQTKANIDKMAESITRMAEAGDTDGATRLKNALAALLNAALEVTR